LGEGVYELIDDDDAGLLRQSYQFSF